jgi:hypothetical protein
MNRLFIVQTLLLALVWAATGCGGGGGGAGGGAVGQPIEINEELLKKIFMTLPDEVMPNVLKTAEQRNEARMFYEYSRVICNMPDEDGDSWIDFTLAIFPFDDGANILLIVQYDSFLETFVLKSDKTLNYHVASGKITETKRPIEPLTADILMSKMDYGDLKRGTKQKMMRWFDQSKEPKNIGYSFIEPMKMIVSSRERTYDDGDYDFSFWQNYSNASFNLSVSYRWDGKRFVREEEHEYSRIMIPYELKNVNLYNSPYGEVMMQANGIDKFIIKSEPTIKDDGSAWYTVCYAIDKDGVITYMPTVLYVAARFASKEALADGDTERMAAADNMALR